MGGHTAPADVFVKRFFLLLNFQRAGSNTGFMRCWVLLLHRSREGWGGGWQWRSIPASKSHCCGAQSLKFRNAKPISFFFLSRCNVLNPSRVAPQPATRGMTTNPRQKTHYGGRPLWLPQQDYEVLIHLFLLDFTGLAVSTISVQREARVDLAANGHTRRRRK